MEFCLFGYGSDFFAPAVNMPGVGEYLAAHTVLKAHAKAYHLYDDEYREIQKGTNVQQKGKTGILIIFG